MGPDGAETGPYELGGLRRLLAEGSLGPTSLVREAGRPGVVPASDVPWLFADVAPSIEEPWERRALPPSPYPRELPSLPSPAESRSWLIVTALLTLLALVMSPVGLGVILACIALACGRQASLARDRNGAIALTTAVIGFFVATVVFLAPDWVRGSPVP